MKALVGYTGFVGSNIYASDYFDGAYNSKNISEAYGTKPDLLIYAGLRAEKYLANNAPEKDMELIIQAEKNIEKINPKRLVLISTIDVFKTPKGVDETTNININYLHPYGYNRYQLELWVRERFSDALIVRLPGLFGKNIKKNFLYDYINVIPFMLKKEKMDELSNMDSSIKSYYCFQNNGFYKLNEITVSEKSLLKEKFRKYGFSALNFTDSRSVFQFYNPKRLWADIQIALNEGIQLWHPATEPVSAGEIYHFLTGQVFINELDGIPAHYDYRTIYDGIWGGRNGYICTRDAILQEIKSFVDEETSREVLDGRGINR